MDEEQKAYDIEQLSNDIQELQSTDAPEDRAQLLINLQKKVNDVIDARDELQKSLDELQDKNDKLSRKVADLFTQITSVDEANDVETSEDLTVDDLL